MAMPVNMILVMYVILCILSYNFNKLTMLYIHVHISISMTINWIYFLSVNKISVCLSGTIDQMAHKLQNNFCVKQACLIQCPMSQGAPVSPTQGTKF